MADESADKEVGGQNSLPHPRMLVAIVIGSVFLVEAVIMNFFRELAETAHGTMDAIILTTVLLPLLYFLIYRPLSRSVKDLKAFSDTLERQVRERTAELESSETLYRTVVTSSVDAIVRINRDGVILMANPAAHRMFGYGNAGLEGKHISLLLPGGHERVLADCLAELPDGSHGAAPVVEAVAVTASGAKLTVECTVSESWVHGERSPVIIMRDVSERKKAEHLLRESKARYRQLSEASFEGIVLAIGGKILDANDAFARMFGYTQEEIVGKTALDLSPPESHAIIMDHITRKSEDVYDALGLKKDGTRFPIEMRGRTTLYQGQIARITAVRDITGRKQAEELLRASQRKFMQFFTMLPVALGVVDKDGIISEINDRFTGTFGYTVEDIPTIKEWWERAYPDEAYRRQVQEIWGNAVAKAAKEGTDIEPLEYKVTCKNGAERFVMIGGIMLDGDVLATFVDVTERNRAEKALFESESRYRLMSEASFEGILINVEGKVLDCNDAFARMFGYTPEEIIGKVPVDLSPPESHAIIMDHIRRESEEVYDVVARKKDGTLFNIEMRGRATMHHGVKARITAMRDITERVKAERAVRESEERLRATFDNSGIGMVFTDLDGRFERVNAALCLMLGHEAQDLVGKSCQGVTHPDDRHIGAGWLRKVASGQSDKQQIEERFIRKNGSVIWCSVAASVIKDAHGDPMHIFSTVLDITDRKQAEEVLRKNNQLLDAIIENIPNMIFLKRASDLRFELFNRAGEALVGHHRQELLGRNDYDFFPKDQADFFIAKDRETLERSGITDIPEEPIKTPSGTRILHTKKLTLRDGRGRPEYLLGISEDITERKAAEDELHKAKEAAEEATRLKDKFISLVSHDLKTPLASMIGFLRLVRHDHGEPLSDGAKLILDRAMESGDAMVHLIEDLLTISRFKTGQLKLNRQFFDAEYLGAMVVANLAHLAQVKGIEMENEIPANYRIYGDKTLLTEAVQNLVSNAIKFCRSGDRITVAASGEGAAPGICVRDTGPGINPEMLADLFKFEKKTSTTGTAGETGSGFGLPLVKSIMDLHGGGLKVESEPGKGSAFSLTLPYVRPKILLVDDDRYSRYLQMQVLRTLNADILEAENGEDALDMIADVRPNLVITDIKMPVIDGLELLKRIKGKPETRDIPVIVISGEYGMEIRDTVFKFGGDDFVTKSRIDTVDFFPRIRRFIG